MKIDFDKTVLSAALVVLSFAGNLPVLAQIMEPQFDSASHTDDPNAKERQDEALNESEDTRSEGMNSAQTNSSAVLQGGIVKNGRMKKTSGAEQGKSDERERSSESYAGRTDALPPYFGNAINTGDTTYPLKGVSKDTEDLDSEIQIEWDNWYKRFEKAIYNKFSVLLCGGDAVAIGGLFLKLGDAPPLKFKDGTNATFACDINSNKQLENLRITSSSGNYKFDSLVLQSVGSLNGKSILRFPKNSRRKQVSDSLALWIDRKNPGFNFKPSGEIEKVRVPKER